MKEKRRKIERRLIGEDEIEYFVDNILLLEGDEKSKAVKRIRETELALEKDALDNFDDEKHTKDTLNEKSARDHRYRDENARIKLREDILSSLIGDAIQSDESKITIKFGGCKPDSEIKSEKIAYVILGLPASGKSTIANDIIGHIGGYLLDTDIAKRKFPEFPDSLVGADRVQSEATKLMFNGNGLFAKDFKGYKSVFEYCIDKGINIVTPRTGKALDNIRDFCKVLFNDGRGYSIHLVLASLPREKATQRAYERYLKNNRYVPLAAIFDSISYLPELNYYKLFVSHKEIFSSFTIIDTDVERGECYKIITSNNNLLLQIYNFKASK